MCSLEIVLRLFEFDFGAQALEIARHGGDCEFLSRTQVRHLAVVLRGVAIDLEPVPFFRVADVGDRHVVVLAPEERNGIEALTSA